MIRIAEADLVGISPMTQSRHYDVPKEGRESPADYEKRTWRQRMHFDDKGEVFIPPMSIKKALEGAAAFLGKKVPGRGQKTYAGFFKSTVLVMDPIPLGINYETVAMYDLFVPSQPSKPNSPRVTKLFGRIFPWKGTAKIYIADETIGKEIFEEHLKIAGQFVGLGMFRPSVGGFFGRFDIAKIRWTEAAS